MWWDESEHYRQMETRSELRTHCRSEVTKRSADLIEIRKGAINLQPVKVSLLPESSSCQVVVALQRIE